MAHVSKTGAASRPLLEITLRGIILGALINVIFVAASLYLGLKVGLNFSSSIPAAIISMAVLSLFGNTNILENNIVQTQASIAGTLTCIIYVLPALLMIGYWENFPYWLTFGVVAGGGVLGIMFSIPLRHAMVVRGNLPFPEGVAAAEVLRVGSALNDRCSQPLKGAQKKMNTGLADLAAGSAVAAVVTFLTNGLHILAEGFKFWFASGSAIFGFAGGYSLALFGAGCLIGIGGGMAIFIGLFLSWGVAVPWLTSLHGLPPDGNLGGLAYSIWSNEVRFAGVGVIGVGSVWTLMTLFKPLIDGISSAFKAPLDDQSNAAGRDMSPRSIGIVSCFALALLAAVFSVFVFVTRHGAVTPLYLAIFCVVFVAVFGLLAAGACGYMAGLVGSSSSPISGIGIVACALSTVTLGCVASGASWARGPEGELFVIGLGLFVTAAVVAAAAVSNDNLQDLKTGYLVGATPWRQQVVLIVGCIGAALVVAPVLNVLYEAYGFAGMAPRPGMNAAHALPAPQANLMAVLATGIVRQNANFKMIGIGAVTGIVLILIDLLLGKFYPRFRLPILAVGMGIYLPPDVIGSLVIGALLVWAIDYLLKRRALKRGESQENYVEPRKRRGVLIASGLIVGESVMGVLVAAVIVVTGDSAPLSILPKNAGAIANWLGFAVFVLVAVFFSRRVLGKRT